MPTMQGTIWAQFIEGTWAHNGSFTFAVHPLNRDITAYSSITYYGFVVPASHHPPLLYWGEAGISRVVSNGQSEDFNPPIQRIKRNNVTEIRFKTTGFDTIHAVHVINYWN